MFGEFQTSFDLRICSLLIGGRLRSRLVEGNFIASLEVSFVLVLLSVTWALFDRKWIIMFRADKPQIYRDASTTHVYQCVDLSSVDPNIALFVEISIYLILLIGIALINTRFFNRKVSPWVSVPESECPVRRGAAREVGRQNTSQRCIIYFQVSKIIYYVDVLMCNTVLSMAAFINTLHCDSLEVFLIQDTHIWVSN